MRAVTVCNLRIYLYEELEGMFAKKYDFIDYMLSYIPARNLLWIGCEEKKIFSNIRCKYPLLNIICNQSVVMLDKSEFENSIAVILNNKSGWISCSDSGLKNCLFTIEFSNELYKDTHDYALHGWLANNYVRLGGRLLPSRKPINQVSILAIMHVYNEKDIIKETVTRLLIEGIDVHIIDDWSDDGTYEELLILKNKYDKRIFLERRSQEKRAIWSLESDLKYTEQIACQSMYEWILHCDADEIRESPWPNLTLAEAISVVDEKGFNAINFTVLNFKPTKGALLDSAKVEKTMEYFEFGTGRSYFAQVKCWKKIPDQSIDLASSGGHSINFQDRKIYPIKFLLKHYPLRSSEQIRKKIFTDRKKRFSSSEKKKGWHIQYDDYCETDDIVWAKDELLKWESNFYEKFFVDRISGVNLAPLHEILASTEMEIKFNISIQKQLYEFCQLHSKIIIYGTGQIARQVVDFFLQSGIDHYECFVVSDGQEKTDMFSGRSVKYFSEVNFKNTGLVLALSKSNQQEVLEKMKENKEMSYFCC